MLSLKAGGTGLNLTAASHVIHFDRWWNPAVENQATDRAFRIGQKRNVLVHKFVCRGTVEEKIDALIEEKTQLAADLLEGGAEKMLTEMTDAQLIRFVSLDIDNQLVRMTMAPLGYRHGMGYYDDWKPYVSVAERRRQAAKKMEALRKKGRRRSAGADRRPQDRQDLLGRSLVRPPGIVQRLREPPAPRPHLRPQRLGLPPGHRQGPDRGQSLRLRTLHRPDHDQNAPGQEWKAIKGGCTGRSAP